MTLNDQDIIAEVYHEANGVFYVKVEILGMYISGITVRNSPKFPEKGLWVQMPSYQSGATWKRYIEFSKQSPLKVIEEKCKEAVEQAGDVPSEDIGIAFPTDEELDNPEKALDDALKNLPI
jgi:hypothetical protein